LIFALVFVEKNWEVLIGGKALTPTQKPLAFFRQVLFMRSDSDLELPWGFFSSLSL
jgi:hypothetical protein